MTVHALTVALLLIADVFVVGWNVMLWLGTWR